MRLRVDTFTIGGEAEHSKAPAGLPNPAEMAVTSYRQSVQMGEHLRGLVNIYTKQHLHGLVISRDLLAGERVIPVYRQSVWMGDFAKQ